MEKTDRTHFPLGRRLFLSQPADVRVDGEGLMKQCLYFLCIFLCSKKSSNVFSCWVQRRGCPGKSELLWRSSRTRNPLSSGFLRPGGLSDSGGPSFKAICIQRMCLHAGSHRINEAKRGNEGKTTTTKTHTNAIKTHLCERAKMQMFVLNFCKKYLYTWPHFSQNSECCILFTVLPLPHDLPLTK